MTETELNGLDEIAIKTEPEDPLLDIGPVEIKKEFPVRNGLHDESDCEDISYFTQIEVDNTRKCLENTRLIIKDFETQLDWHLQQYMTLRNVFPPKNAGKEDSTRRDDHLSIAQLSALIGNHPEGNKKFIKRKGPINQTPAKRKKNKTYDSEEEDSEFSEEDSEDFDEEDLGDSEDMDDPKPKKRSTRSRKGKGNDVPEVKDEIEEEEHALIEPKIEKDSDEDEDEDEDEEDDEDEDEEMEEEPPKKAPAKRGAKKGKKTDEGLKNCQVALDKLKKDIKTEFDKDELIEMLKTKAITDLENLDIDEEKPIAILRHDNVEGFDYNECLTSNVIVTFEDKESLPDYIFANEVVKRILENKIILVQASVFDEHLAEDK